MLPWEKEPTNYQLIREAFGGDFVFQNSKQSNAKDAAQIKCILSRLNIFIIKSSSIMKTKWLPLSHPKQEKNSRITGNSYWGW